MAEIVQAQGADLGSAQAPYTSTKADRQPVPGEPWAGRFNLSEPCLLPGAKL